MFCSRGARRCHPLDEARFYRGASLAIAFYLRFMAVISSLARFTTTTFGRLSTPCGHGACLPSFLPVDVVDPLRRRYLLRRGREDIAPAATQDSHRRKIIRGPSVACASRACYGVSLFGAPCLGKGCCAVLHRVSSFSFLG